MRIRDKLKQISLFSSLPGDERIIDKLQEFIGEETYPKGTYIIREGEVGDTMFILSKGSVVVEKKTNIGDSFPVVKLSDRMNAFFGELALLDNDRRSASVFAETDTVCYLIRRKDFNKFCGVFPQAGYQIVRQIAITLAHKLRKTTYDTMFLIDALCNQEMEYENGKD